MKDNSDQAHVFLWPFTCKWVCLCDVSSLSISIAFWPVIVMTHFWRGIIGCCSWMTLPSRYTRTATMAITWIWRRRSMNSRKSWKASVKSKYTTMMMRFTAIWERATRRQLGREHEAPHCFSWRNRSAVDRIRYGSGQCWWYLTYFVSHRVVDTRTALWGFTRVHRSRRRG